MVAPLDPSPLSLLLGFPHFPPGKDQLPQNGMSANHRLSSDRATEAGAPGRKSGTAQCISLPSPRVRTCSRPLDDGVFHISSTFYSACQALCFIFPIAFPEINQSNTWSEASGIEKTVRPLTVPENRTASRPCLNRYVLAGLSHNECKTIIVFFLLSPLLFISFLWFF